MDTMSSPGSATQPFDLVIVGAGSAGAVVAARASENPALRVALVEAGPDPLAEALPTDLFDGRHNSLREHDWDSRHHPVSGGPSIPFPRGRVTGGSSAVNTAIALRPAPEDLDGWAELGNTEWGFDACLSSLRRLERDLDYGHLDHHGDAGPITIRRHVGDELTETHAAFLETAAALGHPPCEDHNHPSAVGAGPQPMNKLADHQRVSTATGYLAAARGRSNLEIFANTTTIRVLIENGVAVGVETRTDRSDHSAVIFGTTIVVSAGALQTPALLWRSGVGPADAIRSLGVDLVADMPGVGANLDDHPATMLIVKPHDSALADRELPLIQTVLRYPGAESETRADLQIELITYVDHPRFEGCFGLAAVLETTHRGLEGVTDEGEGDPHRGFVRAQSTDPDARPLVESNFGSDPVDVERLADALLDCVPFIEVGPLGELVEQVVHPRLPLSRDGALSLCASSVGSGFHPCGTARMGPAGTSMAVVDQFGRCHRVDNLVVADASIMPFVPRANTNLTSIMVGERIGEWIRTRPAFYGL